MVLVGVSRMGKTGIVFIEPGAKVNSEYYCQHVLGGGLLPDIRARCQRYSRTPQQDGAPSHTARNTAWRTCGVRTSHVAPNSQDLNPVDYAAWGAFQQMVYQRRRNTTINQLKQAIVIEWGKARPPRPPRLESVVQPQGEHIEHLILTVKELWKSVNIWQS